MDASVPASSEADRDARTRGISARIKLTRPFHEPMLKGLGAI